MQSQVMNRRRNVFAGYLCAVAAKSFVLPGIVTALLMMTCSQCFGAKEGKSAADVPAKQRPFVVDRNGKWFGQGISYGQYREGQRPGEAIPSEKQLLEDLEILSKHWKLIRMYGAQDNTEQVLQIIAKKKLDLRVMVGAWMAKERILDEAGNDLGVDDFVRDDNLAEINKAIELANKYPKHVAAVCIGNETQIHWSDHRLPNKVLNEYLRQVRSATSVPVTTADDYNFWNKPESKATAAEVDFIVTHVYAMWAGEPLERAMTWTKEKYGQVVDMHPNHQIVIGEAGWATQMHNVGLEAELIKGKPGEEEQGKFYRAFSRWAENERIAYFYFEAFDEPWKGGPDPREVEKNWGLYRVDRTPKKAMAGTTK